MNEYRIAFYGYEYKILRIISLFWMKTQTWDIKISKIELDPDQIGGEIDMYITSGADVSILRDIIDVILAVEQIVVGYVIHEV